MSHKKYKGFEPEWVKTPAPKDSYRSVFRWGDPDFVKYPKETLYKLIKQRFDLTDEDFTHYVGDIGMGKVEYGIPSNMAKEHIDAFKAMVGEEYVKTDDYSRLSVAYGKTMYDVLRIRQKVLENLPDAVIYPDNAEQIESIVAYCTKHTIPLYVYGGGSSVTRGVECVKGGVSLDMRLRFCKVISFNETDQTITVQAGMSGPVLEKTLNDAVALFGAKRAYTCGHFPQSFEYSSVGGWVVTRGAGQNSTYYGVITDLVLSQEYATPIGNIKTSNYPREATGPNINQIMMGGEGAFGVLTNVTLRVFRYMPQNRKRFSFIFRDWQTAQECAREIMQSEGGYSSVFRLSDAEETDLMLRLYGVDETPLMGLLDKLGFKQNQCCLFLGFTDGEKGYSQNVYRVIKRICRKYKAMSLGGFVCKGWEKGRFTDPYLRDSMLDFGIMTDTLECSVNWSNMQSVYQQVRAVCKKLPKAIVTTHMSHCYPQGANLYFIFIAPLSDRDVFLSYHSDILSAIQQSGASMSHHHGIGKMFGAWLEGSLGANQYGIIRTLKNYFDPDNVMNPGGTLGLDTPQDKLHFPKKD